MFPTSRFAGDDDWIMMPVASQSEAIAIESPDLGRMPTRTREPHRSTQTSTLPAPDTTIPSWSCFRQLRFARWADSPHGTTQPRPDSADRHGILARPRLAGRRHALWDDPPHRDAHARAVAQRKARANRRQVRAAPAEMNSDWRINVFTQKDWHAVRKALMLRLSTLIARKACDSRPGIVGHRCNQYPTFETCLLITR